MDHLIEEFEIYIDNSFSDFYKEWTSNKYKRFLECPSYYELKTLLDSCNILRKYTGWETLSIKGMLDFRE